MPSTVDLIQKSKELDDGDYTSMFFAEASEVLGEPVVLPDEDEEENPYDVFAPGAFAPGLQPGPAPAQPSDQPYQAPTEAFNKLRRPEPGRAIETLGRVGYPHLDTDPSGAGLRSWLRQLVRQL